MKAPALALATLLATLPMSFSARAADIPRCWAADLPASDIEEGLFKFNVDTSGKSAQDVATVLLLLQDAFATQTGVGTNRFLDHIEIDEVAQVANWRPSVMFPTLRSLKDYIIQSFQPAANLPGVLVGCAPVPHPTRPATASPAQTVSFDVPQPRPTSH